MDCCVGYSPVNFGAWYCPIGAKSQDCAYCEYCVKNGCVNFSELRRVTDRINRCTCDCTNKNSHPLMVGLICPICAISNYNKGFFGIHGKCKNCNNQIPHSEEFYCNGCSYLLKTCHQCGFPIKDGNSYITDIKKIIEDKETIFQSKIDCMDRKLERIKLMYRNKTQQEMLDLIINERRAQYFGTNASEVHSNEAESQDQVHMIEDNATNISFFEFISHAINLFFQSLKNLFSPRPSQLH